MIQPYIELEMDNQSTGGFISSLSPGNLAEDILDEVESDSEEENADEDKEVKRNLSLGTPDEYVQPQDLWCSYRVSMVQLQSIYGVAIEYLWSIYLSQS